MPFPKARELPAIVRLICRSLLLSLGLLFSGCGAGDDAPMSLVVYVNGHSMSKLPFVIARDLGLYSQYGLDVEFQMPPPEFEDARIPHAPFWTRVLRRLGLQDYPLPDIVVTGHTPTMYNQVKFLNVRRQVALAATDCSVRYYVVARDGIESLDQIAGKRVGINRMGTTSAFAAMMLVERMGWDRQFDVSIMESSSGVEELKRGRVDVIVGGDEAYEEANSEGFTILADTREWEESLAGNSILVDDGWLERGNNREAARRFLQATLEGLVIFHQQPDVAIDTAVRWYGFPSREFARSRYERADYVPLKPYPCYAGIANTMRIHDSHEMRQYQVEDFYDDSILGELDRSGFIDQLYARYSR